MGVKAEEEEEDEEEEYRLECPWINKVQGCYNRTQESTPLLWRVIYKRRGQRHRGGCEHLGSNIHLHLTVCFEDRSLSFSLKMFVHVLLFKVSNPTVFPLAVCSGT